MGPLAPPENGGDFISISLSPSLVKALDRCISEEAPSMTRANAMLEAFKQWTLIEATSIPAR
jgi:hypothetical protein